MGSTHGNGGQSSQRRGNTRQRKEKSRSLAPLGMTVLAREGKFRARSDGRSGGFFEKEVASGE
jgi:hypothetical protein